MIHFQWSDDEESSSSGRDAKSLASNEVLQYLEDTNINLSSPHHFPLIISVPEV